MAQLLCGLSAEFISLKNNPGTEKMLYYVQYFLFVCPPLVKFYLRVVVSTRLVFKLVYMLVPCIVFRFTERLNKRKMCSTHRVSPELKLSKIFHLKKREKVACEMKKDQPLQ